MSDNLIKVWERSFMVHFNLFSMAIKVLNLWAVWGGYW
jgi:hypothetical protein